MTKNSLSILLLEDEPFDAILIKEHLQTFEDYECETIWVKDRESFLAALDSNCPDIILSDYNLVSFNGLDALKLVNERKLLIPFIFVTGAIDEETAAGTIKAGAWDYVVKDRLFRLPLAIKGALQLREQKLNVLRAEQESRKLLRSMEQSPVLVIVMNVNYKIEYVNKRFTETTGYTLADLSSNDSWKLVLVKMPVNYFTDLQKKGTSPYNWHGEVQSKTKDGSVLWESVSISPLINDENQITHYIIFKEDITPRKRIVEELIKARNKAERSDKLKEAFLQNLSHEIRTPLNAIVGFSSLLNESNGFPQELKDYTTIILSSSNQLLSIVTDILTISRIQTGQEIVTTSEVCINSLCDELFMIFKSQAGQKNIAFSVNKASEDSNFAIHTDETKLVQILTNLLNNAFKYTEKGSVSCGYTLKSNKIIFFVRDSGIGIAPENHKIIFERFRQTDSSFTRTYGGTGLGLSISKSFAELLGGAIWVESAIDQGSTFYLSIPFKHEQHQQNIFTIPEFKNPSREITIVVAEDEKNNYRLIEAILEDACFTLKHASNGREAIEICRNTPAVDLVLMDIKMPEMDGITAMLEIKKLTDAPVVAQTAYALETEKQHLLKIGFSDYISKPIKKEILLEKVIKWTNL